MVHLATLSPRRAKSFLLKNLQRWRADDIRPYADGATELPSGYFGAFVGAAISRPVVSPLGKQRRRKAPTMAVSNICKRNSAVLCRNMVHCGTLCRAIPGGNRRADDIRPYADGATELPSGNFGAPPLRTQKIEAPRKFPGGTCFGLTLSHRLPYLCGCRKARCGFGRLWCRCREPGRRRCFGRRLLRWVGGSHSFLHGRWSQCRPCR